MPTVVVVGLGPAGDELMTVRARELLRGARTARLRTRQHPAAAAFSEIESYDHLYESAPSFAALYEQIASDLATLARNADDGRVVYAVPGSPTVAERTVELLSAREDVTVVVEPAVSVIDLACARLGRDPMGCGLRVVDALGNPAALVGPGPLLVLQAFSPAVLAALADQWPPDCPVKVLHHLGLPDEVVVELRCVELGSFGRADHLTSLWVEELRSVADAVRDLVALTTTLRQRCAWDRDQTHASLAPHLLEEAHEVLDALERYVATDGANAPEFVAELGDLWFQVLIHCELAREAGAFDLLAVADALADKLVRRHPHVFGDVVAESPEDAIAEWDARKRSERSGSVTGGVPLSLPALALYAKLRERATSVGVSGDDALAAIAAARDALARISAGTPGTSQDWTALMNAVGDLAVSQHIDLESAVRRSASALRDMIIEHEEKYPSS
jgi:tetrapyrrole methylase family protein / MazG family protein